MPAVTDPFGKTRRHLQRYRQIADVLVRHGFANVADQLGLSSPKRLFLRRREYESLSVPERAVVALQELGPTFVKFGQSLSTRPDILSDDVIAELERLQDELPPIPFSDVSRIVSDELQAPIETLYRTFDREPLAAATIGQVHRATLFDGTPVVVKVRRPGIERQIATDTEVLTDLAALAERRTSWGKRYAVSDVVDEFARSLEEQLDFVLEAGYAARFRERLPAEGIDIPEVYWELTTQRVLTLAYVETIKITHVDEIARAGHDLPRLAVTLFDYVLRQALLGGMFHGDPHPGNIGVRQDGAIVFVDFGLVGFLDAQLRRYIGDLIVGFVSGDEHAVAVALMDIGRIRDRSGLDELSFEVGRLFRRYYEQNPPRASVGEVLISAVRMVGKYGARVPGEAALFMKTLVSTEGLCLRLDPNMNVREIARPIAHRLAEERYSPQRLESIVRKNAHTTARLAAEMPARFERLMEKVEAGTVKMTVDIAEMPELKRRLDVITNRIVVGVLVAATLVASALMFRSGLGPTWQGIPLLGAGGFITGFGMGARLFIAIVRSGNI